MIVTQLINFSSKTISFVLMSFINYHQVVSKFNVEECMMIGNGKITNKPQPLGSTNNAPDQKVKFLFNLPETPCTLFFKKYLRLKNYKQKHNRYTRPQKTAEKQAI